MNGRAALALALSLILVAACGGPTVTSSPAAPSSTPAPSASPPIATGGTLHVGMFLTDYESFQRSPDGKLDTSWDPQGTWAEPAFELFRCCLLRTLMSYNGQSTFQGGSIPRPDLATGPPDISADGLTWTFHIKPGLRYAPPFADSPIVAQDFIRALEREIKQSPFAPPGDPFGAYGFFYGQTIVGMQDFKNHKASTISGLEAPDPLTLVIHLIQPAGDLAARLSLAAVAPIPPGAADGHDGGYGPYLVASGPYMIEGTSRDRPATGYVPGKSLTLVRNPSWQRSTDDLRAAYVDRIEITNLTGTDVADNGLSLLLAGKLDVVLDADLTPSDLAAVRTQPALASRLHFAQKSTMAWISMNIASPPLDDIHVRRAINYLVDKSAVLRVLDPTARIETHAVPDSVEAGLLADYDPYATADHAGSVEKAKAEMAQSRYDSNHDGVCDGTACQNILSLGRADTPERLAVLTLLRTEVAAIGLTLKPKILPTNDQYFGQLSDPTSHAGFGVVLSWTADYLNGSNWFVPLMSSGSIGLGASSLVGASAAQLKGWGYATTQVPGIDSTIADCVGETGSLQDGCWAEADQYLMERVVPWVPLLSGQASRITSERVVRFSFDQATTFPALDQIALR